MTRLLFTMLLCALGTAQASAQNTVSQELFGNAHGNRHRTRHLLNQEFLQALLLNFRHHGKKAIEKVARNQPAAYVKILALLVPREMKIEHSGGVKAMTNEQLEAGIEAIQAMLEARAGDSAKVIEGTAEPNASIVAKLSVYFIAVLSKTFSPTLNAPGSPFSY